MSRQIVPRQSLERLEVSICKKISITGSANACRLATLAAAAANDNSKNATARSKGIAIKMPPIKDMHDDTRMANAFRELYLRGEFVDVTLVCGGQTFQAHRAMLAAHSDIFKKGLASMPTAVHGTRPEIGFSDIGNPDAVKVMLDYLYKVDIACWEERNPKLLQEIAPDALRLASHFELPGLRSLAARWLLAGVTTSNVLERLAKCEEFGLEDTRIKILRHLAKDKDALSQVSSNKHLMQNPQLLQELLQQAADDPQLKRKANSSVAPKKKARKV